MKKLIHILVIAFIVGLVCVSCRESDLTNNGEGALSLKIGVNVNYHCFCRKNESYAYR